jgi:hypothetical protein
VEKSGYTVSFTSEPRGRTRMRIAPIAALALLTSSLVACSSTPTATPTPAQTATVTATPLVTVTATPTSSSPSQPTAKGTAVAQSRGSTAAFEHFRVTVERIDYRGGSQALVRAKVCVRSLPPDPQGNRTRISWDPWSTTAGTRAAEPGYQGGAPPQMFPSDRTYSVGECADGWIPFRVDGDLDIIRYANGVGDKAVWDADHLDEKPVTRHDEQQADKVTSSGFGEGTFIVGDDIQAGRYQAMADEGGLCYWARLQDDTGDFESIIANNGTSGRASVTIEASDGAFESSGCTQWTRQ